MSEDLLVAVSAHHSVRVSADYAEFVRHAPGRDFVVQTIQRRQTNGLLTMEAEIVIAGREAREQYPLAATYPLHFRKVYYPGRLHGDPAVEFARQTLASDTIGIPPPIGHSPNTYRSCLIPGTPYARCTPFGADPPEANIRIGRDMTLPTAAGLWALLGRAYDQLGRLHDAGLAHGDLELHNLMVTPSPLQTVPIDFEASALRADVDDASWDKLVAKDRSALLREAVYLLCVLGPQPDRLAADALGAADALFRDAASRFRRQIERRLEF